MGHALTVLTVLLTTVIQVTAKTLKVGVWLILGYIALIAAAIGVTGFIMGCIALGLFFGVAPSPRFMMLAWFACLVTAGIAKPAVDFFADEDEEDTYIQSVGMVLCSIGAVGIMCHIIPAEYTLLAIMAAGTLIGYSIWSKSESSTWMSISKAIGVGVLLAILVTAVEKKYPGESNAIFVWMMTPVPSEVRVVETRPTTIAVPVATSPFSFSSRRETVKIPQVEVTCTDDGGGIEPWYQAGYRVMDVVVRGDGSCQSPHIKRPANQNGEIAPHMEYDIESGGKVRTTPHFRGGEVGTEYLFRAGTQRSQPQELRGFRFRPIDTEPVRLRFVFR